MKISLKGIRKINRDINNLMQNIKSLAEELLIELTAIGYNVASVGFDTALYDGINDTNVYIDFDTNEGTAKLIAEGSAVLFIEFGAGVYYYADNPLRNQTEPTPLKIGTYGKGQGSTGKHWFYYGDDPNNPTPSYLGAGSKINYIEPAHYEKGYYSKETRTYTTKKGKITKTYVVYHKPKYRKARYRIRTLPDGVSATRGNPPARAMYLADINIQNNLKSVIMKLVKKYVRN